MNFLLFCTQPAPVSPTVSSTVLPIAMDTIRKSIKANLPCGGHSRAYFSLVIHVSSDEG